jgi:hypothetical protein
MRVRADAQTLGMRVRTLAQVASELTKAYKKGAVSKHKNSNKYSSDKKSGFYCTEHGANPTHNTDACYTLKLKAKKANEPASMTKKSFRRKLNLLSRKTSRNNVLDMYASVIKTEHAKYYKQKKSSPKIGRSMYSLRATLLATAQRVKTKFT